MLCYLNNIHGHEQALRNNQSREIRTTTTGVGALMVNKITTRNEKIKSYLK